MIEYVIVSIFGLLIGSFLNVVIYRVPLGKNIAYPASHCPVCKEKLKPWHNIPVISYLFLGGKCAYCKTKISIRYPIVEILTSIVAVLVYYKMKTIDIYLLINFSIFATLIALSVIDLDYKAVPDSLNLLALTLAFFSSPDFIENFKNALLAIGALSLIRWYVGYAVKREALGEGDIIVAGTMGALLGIKLALIALFISSFIAIFPSLYNRFSKNDLELPFVPFLAIGTFISWFFSNELLNLWSLLYG